MYQFNYHAIAPFVSHVMSIAVFLFLIIKNPKSKLHLSLGLFCLGASLWQFSTGMMFISQTDDLALFWDRVVYIGVNFQWLMHFQFTVLFLNAKNQKKWLIAAYVLALFFAVFTPTDYLVHDIYRYSWGCHSIAGPLHHPFVLVSTGFYMKCLYMIFRKFMKSDNQLERKQYKYYMVGFIIFVSASLAYLPAYKISIYPFAYWFESIYCIILVYIIVRHRMLDIETVVHKTLLWLAVSIAMLIPVALIVYVTYPLLVTMNSATFIASVVGLVTIAIVLYSIIQPRIDQMFQRKKYNYRSIVDAFMDSAVTIHDKEELARTTKAMLKNAIYTEAVRCFWMSEGKLVESDAASDAPIKMVLGKKITDHIIGNTELIERDIISYDPIYEEIRDNLSVLFVKTNSLILLPVVHENRVHGIVILGKKSNLKPYTDLDKKFLHEISIGISFAIINSLVFETQKEIFNKEKEARKAQEELVGIKDNMNRELEVKVKERTEELSAALEELNATNEILVSTKNALWGEMELAKKIQTILLPREPQIAGYEITAYMNPASEVGGDYYDIINAGDRDWIIIGDVSGHGVTAGLVMMMAQTAIHTALEQNGSLPPRELLSIVNDSIAKNIFQMNEDKYMTMTALACHKDGKFVFSGLHQDILVYRAATGRVDSVQTNGMWIGMMSPIRHMLTEDSLQFNVGDVMMLYTDGITEAVRKDKERGRDRTESDMFGDTRLSEIFSNVRNHSIQDIKTRLLAALENYDCNDDVTFIIMKRL